MEHAEKKVVNMNNNNNGSGMFGASKMSLMNGSVTSSNGNAYGQMPESAKVIPIFLPSQPLPESQLGVPRNGSVSGDDSGTPMNLSVRRSSDNDAIDNGYDRRNNNNDDEVVLPRPYTDRSHEDSEDQEELASNFSGEYSKASDSRLDSWSSQTHLRDQYHKTDFTVTQFTARF